MKTFLKIAMLTIILSSCSKSDDNNQQQEPSTQELLIGKWVVTNTSDGTATECAIQTFYDFIDNQNLNHKLVGEQRTLDGSLIGCITSLFDNYTYTLGADNRFSFTTEEFGLRVFKIVIISESNLVLTQETESGVNIILLEKEN